MVITFQRERNMSKHRSFGFEYRMGGHGHFNISVMRIQHILVINPVRKEMTLTPSNEMTTLSSHAYQMLLDEKTK
jgi:hypothetical protein